jgi:hypothetical protein
MYVLFNDILQTPAIKRALPTKTRPQARFRSPARGTSYVFGPNAADAVDVNCFGLAGFTRAPGAEQSFIISLVGPTTGAARDFTFPYAGDGLYLLAGSARIIGFSLDANPADVQVGRIGMGVATRVRTAVGKPLAYRASATPEFDGAGAVVPPRGASKYRTLALECRYAFTQAAMHEIQDAYLHGSLGDGLPLFFDLADEAYKLPFSKFYALDQNIDTFAFSNERGRVSGAAPVHFSHTFDLRECL